MENMEMEGARRFRGEELKNTENTRAVENAEATEKEKENNGEVTVDFQTPYRFEGKDYEKVYLQMGKLKIRDAAEVQEKLYNARSAAALMMTETATAFYRELAAKASGLPIEFFELLSRGKSKLIVRAVRGALNGKMSREDHVMQFEEPYLHEGQQYTEIDLSGIADLTSMDESAVENTMAQAGYIAPDPSFSYHYACLVAAKATGKSEEFFLGLPICETMKLKTMVNSPDFFE